MKTTTTTPKQEVDNEKLSREIQGMVGHLEDHDYKNMVSKKILPNFPITIHDITNEKYMFGQDLSGVRVKTVRNNPIGVDTEGYVKITSYFYKLHKFVTITAYVMFFNGKSFVIMSGSKLDFMTF